MFFRSIAAERRFARLATVVSATVLLAATVGAGAPQPLAVVHASAQDLTLAPGSPQLSKLFTWADGATGTVTDEYTPPAGDTAPVSEAPIDVGPPAAPPAPNAPCSPAITKAKGKLTSGGYIVIEGTCFGTSGNVVISGFPNGDPHVTIEAWTPTALTAQLPKISGVPDLTMHVKVTVGTLSSKTIDANYVAALGDPITLPNKYIKNNVCTLYGACSSAPHSPVGTHWDYSAQVGSDVWTITIPDHFHLQAIHLVHLTSGSTKTTTINASGNEKTFEVAWTEALNGHVTGTSAATTTLSCSGVGAVSFGVPYNPNACSETTTGGTPVQIPTYNNAYRVEPLIVGPAGMTP